MQPDTKTETINPVFAGRLSRKLREATGDLHRVFDNLLEIARGDDPEANPYDRLRATRILYDRGFGKVTKKRPPMTPPESRNPTNPVGAVREPPPAAANRPVAKLEHKLDDTLGPPQAPAQPDHGDEEPSPRPTKGLPAPGIDTPDYTPNLVRDAQYYVMEITDYGDELVSILMGIHEPDPEDDSIKPCHRITAGQMIIDRVIGPAADLEQPPDEWQDPSVESNWTYKHPAEIDSNVPVEKLIEADRTAQKFIDDMNKERKEFQAEYGDREDTGPCYECGGEYLCDYHDMVQAFSNPEEDITIARGMRNLGIFRDRIYMDKQGRLRIHPPPPIDDS